MKIKEIKATGEPRQYTVVPRYSRTLMLIMVCLLKVVTARNTLLKCVNCGPSNLVAGDESSRYLTAACAARTFVASIKALR